MLVVNGKQLDVEPMPKTVQALLQHLKVSHRLLIVEKNEQIVEPAHYETARLAAGDRIEIVHFVGGG